MDVTDFNLIYHSAVKEEVLSFTPTIYGRFPYRLSVISDVPCRESFVSLKRVLTFLLYTSTVSLRSSYGCIVDTGTMCSSTNIILITLVSIFVLRCIKGRPFKLSSVYLESSIQIMNRTRKCRRRIRGLRNSV